MALSNWDTLSVDHSGKPLAGEYKFKNGVTVEFYKNWLYLQDEEAWKDSDASFSKPTIMQIGNGDIVYRGIHIIALRGPQNGVYAVIWHSEYQKQSEDKNAPYRPPIITGMIGCGVYGYSNRKWVGVNKSSIKWFMKEINKQETVCMNGSESHKDKNGKWRIKRTKDYYKSPVYDIPDEFKKLDLVNSKRFNQGDMYFKQHLGIALNATKPGKSKPTTFKKLLKGV